MPAGLAVDNPYFAPYGFFEALTKSDDTTYEGIRGLYIGGAGDVAVADLEGTVVTFKAVPVGTFMPIAVTKLMSTNTTATLVLALR
jgi:hypothetical protein